jgi:hypothetical protein
MVTKKKTKSRRKQGMGTATKETPACAAILIIHGIGEQNPYEALDAFTRGLVRRVGLKAEQMEHWLTWRDQRADTAIRLHLPKPIGRVQAKTVDLIEFYWAGLVQGRITLRQVLLWIARTSLTPLRLWSQNPTVLLSEGGATGRRLWVFGRELLRAVLLLATAAAIILPFVYAAAHRSAWVEFGGTAWALVGSIEYPVAFVIWLVLVVLGLAILNQWLRLLRPGRFLASTERHSLEWWRRLSFIALAALGLVAWGLHEAFDLQVPMLVYRLWATVQSGPVLAPVLAILVAAAIRKPIVKYMGDIALYVTADERSTLFRTRAEILKEATTRLQALLRDSTYRGVYVVGHSLGSVIAYDAINYLTREVRAEPRGSEKLTREDFERLRGLLTFGSPLDKVYYFFRTEVGDEEAVRAQILSSLHGFRKEGSKREYGELKLARYRVPELKDFRWWNVYSSVDFVSGHLDFYKLDRQVHRGYWNPVTAHIAYWNDPRFYATVEEWL